jgi:hypothetical protein
MLHIRIGTVVALIILFAGTAPSLAQRTSFTQGSPVFPLSGSPGPNYTVCIGSSCNFGDLVFPCYTSVQAAATAVCQSRLGGSPLNLTSYTSFGGHCGYIRLSFSCSAQAGYNACIGQYPGNCRVSGLYPGRLDYSFGCGVSDQAAASQICAGKGWSYGTAVRAQTYPGNQCGYATVKVTCH